MRKKKMKQYYEQSKKVTCRKVLFTCRKLLLNNHDESNFSKMLVHGYAKRFDLSKKKYEILVNFSMNMSK